MTNSIAVIRSICTFTANTLITRVENRLLFSKERFHQDSARNDIRIAAPRLICDDLWIIFS